MKATKTVSKVVILDDEKNVETAIRGRLPRAIAAVAQTINPDKIADLVGQLGSRIAQARKGASAKKAKFTQLDDADLFIVDYDLVGAKGEDYLTGETIAYLARCYSRCGVIVALNQFHRRPTFDLTLRPLLDSFADINVSADDLSNPGLWGEKGWLEYRPWSWPIIPKLVALMRQRVRDVEKANLDVRVVDFLQFPRSAVERLPTSSLELLGGIGRAADSARLRDILSSPVLGFRGKEAEQRKGDKSQDARIIAARLVTWLNMILGPQDVLVDAPHLAERCPSLIDANATAKTMSITIVQNPVSPIFRKKELAPAKLKKAFWFDRPVWFWTEIERQRILLEIKEPWNAKPSALVFCEDTSSFGRRAESKSFQSDLLSPYRTRHVRSVSSIDYQPAHRLALR